MAEISFDLEAPERPAESFLVFTADKCGPGAYNFPFLSALADPNHNSGLLTPHMFTGFSFTVFDMNHAGRDSVIRLSAPEDYYKLSLLLRDINRYGIDAAHSRMFPHQCVLSVSAHRLHTIAGKYTGKDDPIAVFRTQSIFPAYEEVVMPFVTAHLVAGGARGSHHMPLMPVAVDTAVTGPYCLPIVACVAYSVNKSGILSEEADIFGNCAWDLVRLKAQQKAADIRTQGVFSPAMVETSELGYSSTQDILKQLETQFAPRD